MTKQIFTQSQQPEEEEILPKQEFYNVEIPTEEIEYIYSYVEND